MTYLSPTRSACPTRVRAWSLRLLCLAAVILIGVLGLSRPSAAHTDLLSSSPANGTTLAEPPRQVELEFTEPMAPSLATIMLTVPGGQPVDIPVRSGDRDTVLLVDVPPSAAPEGTWRVSFRVTSVDGHPIAGKIDFDVSPGVSTAPLPSETPSAAEPAQPGAAETPFAESVTVQRDSGTGWGWAGQALIAGVVALVLVTVLMRSRGTRSGRAGQSASTITKSDRDDATKPPPADGSPRNSVEGPAS